MNVENNNQIDINNEYYILLPTTLDKMINYIENMEVMVDNEFGDIRNLTQIIIDNDMPEIYNELLAIKKLQLTNKNYENRKI